MNPTKCPHCGAEWIDTAMTFACGSYGRTDGLKRHAKCYERQIAALQSELEIEKGKVIGLETGKYGVRHLGMQLFELQSELAKRQWQPIETAPLDVPLQLGWWETWPEKKWVQEVELAGHANSKGLGMSNAWLHGQATHWQPLPEPPKE